MTVPDKSERGLIGGDGGASMVDSAVDIAVLLSSSHLVAKCVLLYTPLTSEANLNGIVSCLLWVSLSHSFACRGIFQSERANPI